MVLRADACDAHRLAMGSCTLDAIDPGEANAMSELPSSLHDQRKTDLDQLRLLAIFHFVVAGLAIAGIGFLAIHYAFMHAMMTNPDMWRDSQNGPPPAEFMAFFVWFYVGAGAMCLAAGIGNLLSGLFLRKRKNRLFSLIVAGFDLLQFPFGTVLGTFTLIVLLRDSVREAYES